MLLNSLSRSDRLVEDFPRKKPDALGDFTSLRAYRRLDAKRLRELQ